MKLCAAQSQTPGVTQGHLSQNLAAQPGDLGWEQQPCTGDQNFKFRKALNSNCIFIFVFFILPAIWSHHMRRDLRPRHTSYVQYKSTTSPVILHICLFDFVRFLFFFTSSNTSSSVNRPGGKKQNTSALFLSRLHIPFMFSSLENLFVVLSVFSLFWTATSPKRPPQHSFAGKRCEMSCWLRILIYVIKSTLHQIIFNHQS